uniref:Kunitz-type serine protease inhibitor conotoxin Cal9.1a n=1 Tax=Californiconus californicus TaxID=1736779 RepID=VKT1A_CONCL|nr:RecName: Full=Kunitz-type serine protease inhibitor conotoxin Cal9.1a; AltName: Full=Conkunitzin-Cal9.1a; Flags: Precursor [Californiconus californicus]ADB04231.1 conotoxin Cal 9.1a precursor [Californiconus californicus]
MTFLLLLVSVCMMATGEERTKRDVCELPFEEGPCFAAIRVYAYNAETGDCEQLTYGGCEGNGNRFATLEDCDNACARY